MISEGIRVSALQFRNINATPDDPVERWGVEGILAAIDRGPCRTGDASPRLLRADPWGPVAADLEQALKLAEDVGVAATLGRALDSRPR